MESHDNLKRKFGVNMRERDTDCDRIKELEDTLDTRQAELEALQAKMDDYSAEVEEHRRQRSLLTQKDTDGNRRTVELERQIKDKTSEVERLRSRVRDVEKQNAVRDLDLVSLKKELKARAEDFHQLEIALDAKQQELNMVRALPLSAQWVIDCTNRLNGKIPSRALGV